MRLKHISDEKHTPNRQVQVRLNRVREANADKRPEQSEQPPKSVQPPQSEQPRAASAWRELGVLGIKIAVIALTLALIFTFVYGFHRNTDPDMAPMTKTGDLVLFYRLNNNYAIGDLIVLDFQGQRQIRRIVAGAGDTVDIADGGLIVNGAMQQEPEIYAETWRYENGIIFPLTVQTGQVFVLGDARENATDSRVYGSVDTKDILGTVITVIRRRNF